MMFRLVSPKFAAGRNAGLKQRCLPAALLAAAVAAVGGRPASAANTDVYLDWGLPADPGWYWVHYLDYVNHGNSNSIGDTMQIEYQTRTGLTGTARDSFEFWGGFAFGNQSTAGAPNSNAWGVSAPQIGSEWYYKVFETEGKQGDPNYRVLTISPWVQVNAPSGVTTQGGYGSGADQWSYIAALLGTYRTGRFTTTLQPVTLTYAQTNQNTSQVVNPDGSTALSKEHQGWSGSFGVFNIGYDVSPTLTLGLYQGWNAYSFADTKDSPRQTEGTIGPTFEYTGLNDDYGITVDGTAQVDYYHSDSLRQGYFFSLYVQKKF
jgi:hypothetical protein